MVRVLSSNVAAKPAFSARFYATQSFQRHINSRAPALRLMPIGGSVTYGQGSSHGNGYRGYLRQMLIADGYKPEMVGSRKAGVMQENWCEGWRGFRIDQIDQKAQRCVPGILPNLFTVNAGSNDCIQDFDLEHIGIRIRAMLEHLWAASPYSTIILSTLLVTADERVEDRILRANQQYLKLADDLESEGCKIVVADMHGSDGPQRYELMDGTHPNDDGYKKMAKIWHRGVREADRRGFL
ncbi:hypothetical protein EsH8_VI_000780 [Colletotrichum jinshuiense]